MSRGSGVYRLGRSSCANISGIVRFSICESQTRSISVQIHLIQPDAIRFLLPIAVHLEGNIDLLLRPIGLGVVIGINVVFVAGHTERDVMHLVSNPLELPYHMNPGLRGKIITGDRRRAPHPTRRVPDIPMMRVVEIALRAPSPARTAEGLVHVKFE